MTPQFSEIGDKFGPFDITFIEMAAYDEMWPDLHLNPEEAVQVHIMLKGKQLVPIHWGRFDLAFHSWQEPIERIIVAAEKNKVSLLTSKICETVVPFEHENSFGGVNWKINLQDQCSLECTRCRTYEPIRILIEREHRKRFIFY